MQELASGTLDPTGNELEFDEIVIHSPGFSGNVTVSKPTEGESRAQALESDALAEALGQQNVDTDYVIELGDVSEEATDSAVTSRSMAPGQAGIEITVPAVGDGWGQMLLVTDENGVASWQLPVTEEGEVDTTRGGSTVTFVVPAYAAESTSEGSDRGALGWLGKKVIRVLSFAIDDAVGKVGDFFASKWEEKNRPYSLRRITSETYRENHAGELTGEDWEQLGTGRSLLFIHGTFSRASTAFYELTPEFIDELNERYSGRVFAFDHKTLSEDPTDNGRYFAKNMPDGLDLDVDIVCHSRGGHVSRVLSEGQAELPLDGKTLKINQVVFVASPNRGTVLASPKYMGDFVDAHTNILSALPANVVADVLEVIITVVKQLAVGALKGLEGLQSMNPQGDYIKQFLNTGPAIDALYRAIAANFDPTKPEIKPWAKDKLMDWIFKEANDLVVPTEGVYEENGAEMFPIDNRLDLGGEDDVHHGNFFGNEKVVAQLREWLAG